MDAPDMVTISPQRAMARHVPLWFALAIFASAFLMFLLEPMIAKMFLPHLGGGPVVWNTCLVFFQLTLLAGYAFAHGADRLLGTRAHALLYSLIVLAAALQLPFVVAEPAAGNAGPSVGWLLAALAGAIGLPFFVLATTTSSLQKWFARTGHHSAHDPYFLYAGSNAGNQGGIEADAIPTHGRSHSLNLTLPPLGAVILKLARHE